MNYFNLERLEDLPPLADIQDLDEAAAKLDQQSLEAEEFSDESIVIVSHQTDPEEDLPEVV